MPVPSLVHLATKRLLPHYKDLFDVGDLPYRIIGPVLRKIDNPEQLKEIERNSPQIKGEDAEIWKAILNKSLPRWNKNGPIEPKNEESWCKLYDKLLREDERRSQELINQLRQKNQAIEAEKNKNKVSIVDGVIDPRKKASRNFSSRVGGLGTSRAARFGDAACVSKPPLAKVAKLAYNDATAAGRTGKLATRAPFRPDMGQRIRVPQPSRGSQPGTTSANLARTQLAGPSSTQVRFIESSTSSNVSGRTAAVQPFASLADKLPDQPPTPSSAKSTASFRTLATPKSHMPPSSRGLAQSHASGSPMSAASCTRPSEVLSSSGLSLHPTSSTTTWKPAVPQMRKPPTETTPPWPAASASSLQKDESKKRLYDKVFAPKKKVRR